jgi:diketogulonate reductase-like aldo/keto reductase
MSNRGVTSAARGPKMPSILYGTAWKKDSTRDLVLLALRHGFTGIDTACQPRHYNEAGVGEGIRLAFEAGVITRERLFVQTKFSPIDAQDKRTTPYDRKAPIPDQVRTSVAVSKKNLGVEVIDSLVLHSPYPAAADMLAAWRAMEEAVERGDVLSLGISNVYDLKSLQAVYDAAVVKPTVVQNRFVKDFGYSTDIRQFCAQHGIAFQSFWTLTGNPHILESSAYADICRTLREKRAVPQNATAEQIFFRFLMDIGITPLSGTQSEAHMDDDVAVAAWPSLPAAERDALAKFLVVG